MSYFNYNGSGKVILTKGHQLTLDGNKLDIAEILFDGSVNGGGGGIGFSSNTITQPSGIRTLTYDQVFEVLDNSGKILWKNTDLGIESALE